MLSEPSPPIETAAPLEMPLAPMTLPAPAAEPPMTVFGEPVSIWMPSWPLPSAVVPSAAVPM